MLNSKNEDKVNKQKNKTDNKENLNQNMTSNDNHDNQTLQEISKLREQIQMLTMSVKDIQHLTQSEKSLDNSSRQNHFDQSSKSKSNRFTSAKRGLKAAINQANSSNEESGIEQNCLSSDDSDKDCPSKTKIIKKHKQSTKTKTKKRSTSRTKFSSFQSKNKLGSKSNNFSSMNKDLNEMNPSSNLKQSNYNFDKTPEVQELTQSKLKYNEIMQKAMQEIGQYTSDDQGSIIMKKREHLVNSLKKEFPRHSNRLENMLKNAALNSETDSMENTPSEKEWPQVAQELNYNNYQAQRQQDFMMPEKEYDFSAFNEPHEQSPPLRYPQPKTMPQKITVVSPQSDSFYNQMPLQYSKLPQAYSKSSTQVNQEVYPQSVLQNENWSKSHQIFASDFQPVFSKPSVNFMPSQGYDTFTNQWVNANHSNFYPEATFANSTIPHYDSYTHGGYSSKVSLRMESQFCKTRF